jgi:hypothetical protein
MTKWNPEEAGRLAALAERGGGPNEAITARRPFLWKPGTRAQLQDRSHRGGKRGNSARALGLKLDRVLGPVDVDDE